MDHNTIKSGKITENVSINPETALLSSIHEHIKNSTEIGEIRCKLRQIIHNFLNFGDKTPVNSKNSEEDKELSSIRLLNQMIKEYLEWNCYMYTADLFEKEANVTDASRDELESKVKIDDDLRKYLDKDVPLLLQILISSMK